MTSRAAAATNGPLLGIGAAAQRLGVSERALRYYQQIGLIVPAGTTPGGLRRYSPSDLARVERIVELKTLLGLNLDEIALVLRNEDRIAQIRLTYHDERTSEDERRRLIRECLALQEDLRGHRRGEAGRPGDLPGRPGRPHRPRPRLPGRPRHVGRSGGGDGVHHHVAEVGAGIAYVCSRPTGLGAANSGRALAGRGFGGAGRLTCEFTVWRPDRT